MNIDESKKDPQDTLRDCKSFIHFDLIIFGGLHLKTDYVVFLMSVKCVWEVDSSWCRHLSRSVLLKLF